MALENCDRLMNELAKREGNFEEFNKFVFGLGPDGSGVHSGQEDYFYHANKKYNILTCGNSWGKTEFLARKHAYDCIYKAGMNLSWREKMYVEYNTLNASYEYGVSEKVFNRITALRVKSRLMDFLIAKVDATDKKIWFKNGSTHAAGTTKDRGKHIEGDRFALLSIEEAGYETNLRYLRDSVLAPRTLVPSMPGGGRIHFIGTPKPFSDPEYYVMFKRGLDPREADYYSREGSTYENTYLDIDQIRKAEEELASNPLMLAQVVYGKFVSEEGAPFEHARVANIFCPQLVLPDRPKSGHLYVCSWDLARKRDLAVGFVLDFTYRPLTLLADCRPLKHLSWPEIYSAMARMHYQWGSRGIIIDSTGIGDVVLSRVREEMHLPVEGITFTSAIKQALIENLQQEFDRLVNVPPALHHLFGERTVSAIKCAPLPVLEKQLLDYRWDDKGLDTDYVFALAIGSRWLNTKGGATGTMRGDYNAKMTR